MISPPRLPWMANSFGFVGNQGLLSANRAIKQIHAIECAALVLISELKQSLTVPLIEVHKTRRREK
jgi:hypothetical protein